MRFCKFAVCCALFIGACIQAHSQTRIRVNLPFDFTVGNQTLPAGKYNVATIWGTDTLTWQISNRQGKAAFFATNAVSSPKVDHTCSLLFRRLGGEYSLVEFWLDGNEGRDVIRPKIARTVIAQSDLVQIAAER
jgi:hypothetical protein